MGTINFSKDNILSHSIILDTSFVTGFMPEANADQIKIYLLLVAIANNSIDINARIEDFAKALSMTAKDVCDALEYWNKLHVITVASLDPLKVELHDVQQALRNKTRQPTINQYIYKDLNRMIQTLFPNREVQRKEFELIHSCVYDFGLPQDVVIMLVHHYVTIDGPEKLRFERIYHKARQWAELGVDDCEKAEAQITLYNNSKSGVQRVLTNLGINEPPLSAEVNLYSKWQQEYGFNHEAILYACEISATKMSKKSLDYIDKVLYNFHVLGLHRRQDMMRHYEYEQQIRTEIGTIIDKLAIRNTVNKDWVSNYKQALDKGFDYKTILTVADKISTRASRNRKVLFNELDLLVEKGYNTLEQILKHYNQTGKHEAKRPTSTSEKNYSKHSDDIYSSVIEDFSDIKVSDGN